MLPKANQCSSFAVGALFERRGETRNCLMNRKRRRKMYTKLRNGVSMNYNKKEDALQHARKKRLGLQHAMTNGIEEEDAGDAFGTSTVEHAFDATR